MTVLLGARQVGKTTLARYFAEQQTEARIIDLETPEGAEMLRAQPYSLLKGATGLVVIDEVQRLPELFTVLRPLCDSPSRQCRFLLLGSASPDIMRGVSESLAGRARYVEVGGLTLEDTGGQAARWLRGGFPLPFLAADDAASFRHLEDLTRSFIERDLQQAGSLRLSVPQLRQFWMMLAHYHGQVFNAAAIARDCGLDVRTLTHLRNLMEGCFFLRVLHPWCENLGKRLVKSPKIYFRDSGLFHHLIGVRTFPQLQGHPRIGASWEGFALEQVLSVMEGVDPYFWAAHGGAELDLLLVRGAARHGFEFKCGDAPVLTKSMKVAMNELKLERLWVIYPGEVRYSLAEGVEVLPLRRLEEHPWGGLVDLPGVAEDRGDLVVEENPGGWRWMRGSRGAASDSEAGVGTSRRTVLARLPVRKPRPQITQSL